jgi:hypothetical protein
MRRGENDPVLDPQRLREQIQRLEAKVRLLEAADIVIDGSRVLKIRAPAGHYFKLQPSDAGALVLTDMGTTL